MNSFLSNPPERNASQSEPVSRLRIVLRFTWILVALAALYAGWVIYSRRQENLEIEQRALEKKRAADRVAVEQMGGDRFDILNFYASSANIRRGETAQLCYGVSNAKTVRLEPQPNAVWPSVARCVDVAPTKNTTYTLTIEDGRGNTKSASLTVKVQ
ncbi:MAG: hypothetical protein L0Z50_12295 [Verrucomicrobiales bacterium]|nr:hypothetical protein [Verrucomicrobiales bacterium]